MEYPYKIECVFVEPDVNIVESFVPENSPKNEDERSIKRGKNHKSKQKCVININSCKEKRIGSCKNKFSLKEKQYNRKEKKNGLKISEQYKKQLTKQHSSEQREKQKTRQRKYREKKKNEFSFINDEYEEKKIVESNNIHNTTHFISNENIELKKYAIMTDEERDIYRAKRRNYYHSLSKERREKFKAEQRERSKNLYNSMTKEQRDRKKAMHYTYLASLSKEQLEVRKAARRESVRKYRRSLTEEQRELMNVARREKKKLLVENQQNTDQRNKRFSFKNRMNVTDQNLKEFPIENQLTVQNIVQKKDLLAQPALVFQKIKNVEAFENDSNKDGNNSNCKHVKENYELDLKLNLKYLRQDNVSNNKITEINKEEKVVIEIKPDIEYMISKNDSITTNKIDPKSQNTKKNANLNDVNASIFNEKKIGINTLIEKKVDCVKNSTLNEKSIEEIDDISENVTLTNNQFSNNKIKIKSKHIKKKMRHQKVQDISNLMKDTVKKINYLKENKKRCKRVSEMTEEEIEKKRTKRRNYYHSLSEEKREKYKAAQRKRLHQIYHSMTEEQREQKKSLHFTYLASLTEEQLEKRKEARRESVRKYRRSLTEEQREMMNAARRKPKL